MDLIHSELTAILFHVVWILQLSLDLYYTEDEIYELSYTKEPKNPKIQVSPSHQTLSSSQLLQPRFTQGEALLCSAVCGCNIFKTNAHTRCWIISKWATSKCSTLEKHVMWWACSFFLFFLRSPSCIISSSLTVQPATQDKPPVVAEWGSGVTPRHDPDTISKHVNQMVDVSIFFSSKLCFSLPHCTSN